MIYSFVLAPDVLTSKLIDDKESANLKQFREKCDGLIKMISRDRMKVVFFGRYILDFRSTLVSMNPKLSKSEILCIFEINEFRIKLRQSQSKKN